MMVKMNRSNQNEAQHMTSLEIAQLSGKNHKDVLKAIRNMEPGWVQIAGRKFALGSYKDANGQMRPCYQLTKTLCLYHLTCPPHFVERHLTSFCSSYPQTAKKRTICIDGS